MHTEEDEAIAKRPDQALASPRFSRAHFMGLPLELRLIIWDLAIPRRATVIREEVWEKPTRHIEDWESCYPTYATYRFDPPRRPPAVAHVCREAREVCRPGRMFSADSTKNIPPHERQRYPVGNRVQFSWFDPDRDALMVDLVVPNESYPRTAYESHCIQAIGELARTTQHVILVDAQYMHPQHCFIEALYNPRHFPRLQTVSICTREVEVRSPKILRLLREVCWLDQEESDNPIIQLTDDYEVANAREIDELQRRLKALAATTGDDGDKVDALCSSLAQLKEPTRPGLFPRPRVGDDALLVRDAFLGQCIMWTPLDGLHGHRYPRDGWPDWWDWDHAPANRFWIYVLEHLERPEGWDEEVPHPEDYVLRPPPGWVDYARSLSPKLSIVALVKSGVVVSGKRPRPLAV
ncbi:hypothetical protein PG995_015774 [Apiospora arundinis]